MVVGMFTVIIVRTIGDRGRCKVRRSNSDIGLLRLRDQARSKPERESSSTRSGNERSRGSD